MNQIEWYGLYGESWQGEIVPEAFSHPAKYSRAMIRQVYQHMIDMGYIKAGDRIVDPFGGVGLGAFDAMKHGLHWHGCELEPRFVELGNQNLELWQSRYAEWFANWGTAVLRQGDSRYLAQVIGEAEAVVSSSPYSSGTVASGNGIDLEKTKRDGDIRHQKLGMVDTFAYGSTPGQLGSMKEGDFDAVVSSSPYGDAVQTGDGPGARWDEATHPNNPDKVSSAAEYGRTPGQLGNMRMDAAVSSAPFSGSMPTSNRPEHYKGFEHVGSVKRAQHEYGESRYKLHNEYKYMSAEWIEERRRQSESANIARLPEEAETVQTFWQAARQIVQQVHEVLKPGGYAAWVTGNFRRNGEIVDFGGQWLALCESCGFVGVEHIIAWKVERRGTQLDIFGNGHSKDVSRVSFFRRLDNAKNPGQEIENEDIWIVQKPR